jgi:hypothetical protein
VQRREGAGGWLLACGGLSRVTPGLVSCVGGPVVLFRAQGLLLAGLKC